MNIPNSDDLVMIRRGDLLALKQEAIFGVFRRDAVEWDKLNALLANAPVVSGETKDEIQTLRAKVASADDVRDAERYRYLRDCGHGFDLSVREETEEGEIWVTGYPPDELNKAIDQALANYDKLSEDNIMEKSLSLAKSQLNNYKKLSEVKHEEI